MSYMDLNESINAAFTALQAALGEQLSVLRMEIGCAAETDQLERRNRLTDKAKKLSTVSDLVFQALQSYVEFTRELSSKPTTMPPPPEVVLAPTPTWAGSHHKAPKTGLEVRLDGVVYHESKACETFCAALSAIGLQRVHDLQERLSGFELVSRRSTPRNERGYPNQRQVDGWHIVTHSSNEDKKAVLERICARLRVPIEVKVIPPHLATVGELLDSILE